MLGEGRRRRAGATTVSGEGASEHRAGVGTGVGNDEHKHMPGFGACKTDLGSVTAEFALGLPSLVLILALSLSAVAWGLDLEAAQRGASEAARAAVVDSDEQAAAVGARALGGATSGGGTSSAMSIGPVTISRSGGFVTACVAVERVPWPRTSRCATARDRP